MADNTCKGKLIIEIRADNKPFKKGMDEVQKNTEETVKATAQNIEQGNKGILGKFKGFVSNLSSLAKGAIIAFGIATIKKSIDEGLKWIQIEENLANQTKKLGDESGNAAKRLSELADQIQSNGIIAGDTLKEGQTQLLQWGLGIEDVEKHTNSLANILADLSRRGQDMDIKSLTDLIGTAATTGRATQLAKYVKDFDKLKKNLDAATKPADRMNIILDAINDKFAGENSIKTAGDQIKNMKNQWDDVVKTLGASLIPFLQLVLTILKPILNVIEKVVAILNKAINSKVGKFLLKALEWGLYIFTPWWIVDGIDKLSSSNPKPQTQSSNIMMSPNSFNRNVKFVNQINMRQNRLGEYVTNMPISNSSTNNINYGIDPW